MKNGRLRKTEDTIKILNLNFSRAAERSCSSSAAEKKESDAAARNVGGTAERGKQIQQYVQHELDKAAENLTIRDKETNEVDLGQRQLKKLPPVHSSGPLDFRRRRSRTIPATIISEIKFHFVYVFSVSHLVCVFLRL